MPEIPQQWDDEAPGIVGIPPDFEGYVPPKRVGELNMFGEWLSLSKPAIPQGEATVIYVVSTDGKASVIQISSPDNNGAREEVLARAIVAAPYEPAYITQDYVQGGMTVPANSKVLSLPISKTFFWHSPVASASEPDQHWICNQKTKSCSWIVKVSEGAPAPTKETSPKGWDHEHASSAIATTTKNPKKRRSLVPAVIVGGFAGWWAYGKMK